MATALPFVLFVAGLVAVTVGVGMEAGLGYALIVGGLLLAAGCWLFVRGTWISSAAS